MTQQPIVYSEPPRKRPFTTTPIAVQAIIINEDEKILLMNSPTRKQGWQTVSGAFEAEETILDATIREVGEELGEGIRVRPLCLAHAETFHYDNAVRYMSSMYTLFVYEGGEIVPGDDMIGSEVKWWPLGELQQDKSLHHPTIKLWLFERAIQLYRLWKEVDPVELQPKI